MKIRRPIKYNDSSSRAHQLKTRATLLGTSIQSFLLWLPSRTDQVLPSTTVNFIFCLFFVVVVVVVFFSVDGYVATTYGYFTEVSVDDILSKVFMMIHTYIHIYIHTGWHTHTHTLIHMTFLPTVYYSCHLVVFSYYKSYQQYFHILLNYKKTRNLLP